MKYRAATVNDCADRPAGRCVIPGRTPLRLVVSLVDATNVPFILVEDDNGHLMGIVETAVILDRLASSNARERERWCETPVEAALQWKISPQSDSTGHSSQRTELPSDCTAVSSENGVVALVSSEDIFLSWQSVRESLLEATVDSVTQLPNRLVFERRLSEELDRASRDHHSIAVILFDVDHFKEVNDMFGHGVGDATLEAIAVLLKRELRSYDTRTRYGGDEFAAICSGCQPGEIDIPLQRIQRALKSGFASKAIALPPISLSIGAAVIHDVREGQNIEEVVELADTCLYRAKENGRDSAWKMELPGPAAEPVAVYSSNASQPTRMSHNVQ